MEEATYNQAVPSAGRSKDVWGGQRRWLYRLHSLAVIPMHRGPSQAVPHILLYGLCGFHLIYPWEHLCPDSHFSARPEEEKTLG